VPVILWF